MGLTELNLGSIKIPLNATTKTFAILAKRGAGKSYTGAVLAEELFKNNIPFVVFDPIDVWWGLRFNSNGKDKGLPIVVFGKEHSDIPLSKDMGVEIAEAVVKENISCIISTFGMPKNQQRQLITDFSEKLLEINNTPRHIFIEEAHEFIPQRVFGALGRVFNAVSNLVVMGRNRGIGVTLINQRAATINKDVLTQIDTLLAFRNIAPQDRKALREWVEHHAAEGDFEKFMSSLPSLPTGEGWIWSPEFMEIFERIKIRKRETFHPDREKLDSSFEMPVLTQVDVQSFIDKFVKKTKKEEKKFSIPESERPDNKTAVSIDMTAFHLASLKNQFESQLIQKDTEIRQLKAVIVSAQKALGVQLNGDSSFVSVENNAMLSKLGGMPKKIYETLLKHSEGLTKPQVGLMTGYSYTSGSFANALAKLRTMGLITKGEPMRVILK